MADEIQAIKPFKLAALRPMELPEIKPIGTDSAPKKQSLREWAMAGGGIPEGYKDRPDVWHRKVMHFAAGGEVYNTEPDMSDGGQLIDGPAFAGGGWAKAAKAVQQASKMADEAVVAKKIEAPSIVIPSKISNVKEAVRQSKGDFGARRVERAADEIPNLERLYKEEALRHAFSGDNAKALMTMNPKNFERYSAPLDARFTDEASTRYTPSGERMSYREYIEDYLPSVGGFNDVPFLQINKQEQGLPMIPFISGHEGRHRNRVLANKGEKAGLVQLVPRAELREPFPRRDQEEYIQALRHELEMTGNLVLPEKQNIPGEHSFGAFKEVQRPAIVLPDIYAKGGEVHMAKGGKMGVGLKIADAVADASKQADAIIEAKKAGKLEEALAAKTAPMTTPQGTGLPLMPRSQGMYTPGVKQEDLPRMPNVDKARAAGKSPKYTERMQDLLDSPTARKKVDTLIRKGEELGMREWYGTEPLRQVAMEVGLSPDEFKMFMAQMASASQRNPVDQQNKMGSYLWHLSRTGQLPDDAFLLTNKIKKNPSLAPEGTPIELPPSYGSLAQGDIFSRGKQIASGDIEGALPPEKKLGTFYRNYLGNLRPVTVDVNAVRGPIIERGDPRWLASKLVEKDEEGRVIAEHFPRRDVAEGRMSLKEARDRPGFWEAAPSGSEYAGFEDLWQRGAKRHGLSPAEAQALGWYGSADVTALKTKPELYIDNLERMIRRTAEETGQSPLNVMEDVLRGKEYLRKEGGPVEKHFDGGGLAAADFAGPSDDDDYLKARLTAKILAGMAKDQATEEGRSMSSPRAVTDLLNRGMVAPLVGTAADIGNLALEGVDYLREKASGKPVEKRLASDRPFMGTEHIRDLMREYGMTTDTERPMMETGLSIVSPGGALKGAVKGAQALPKAGRAVEGGLNAATAAMRRPFTPATVTMEAVAPDLAKYKPRDWQETVTRRLTGEGAPVSMDVLGGRKTTKRPGQGVYENFESQLETNPLVAIDVPFAGSLSGNKALRSDITTAGQELAQESVAAHRFVPMATNQIKDASAMLIGTKDGKLSNKEIIELGERLPGMIVAHNPRLGGIVVMPYDYTKGKVPSEFYSAQDVAKSVLGKRADFTYGKADPMKDRLYIERSDYVKEGARPSSAESKAMRERLQKAEERLFRAPAQSNRGPRQGRTTPATSAD